MEYCAPNGWLLSAFIFLNFVLGVLVGWFGMFLANEYRRLRGIK